MSKKEVAESGIWLNNVDDLAFGLGIVAFTYTIGYLLKKFISQDNMRIRRMYKRVLYEFIGTAESAVFAFELNYIVYENYSFLTFLLVIFLNALWTGSGEPEFPTMANPVVAVSQYLKSEIRFELVVIIIFAQFVGGLAPYFFLIRPVWGHADWWCIWKVDNVHRDKMLQRTWATAVIPRSPIISALTEASVTCLMYLTSKLVPTIPGVDGGTAVYLTLFINSVMAGCGNPFCGGYYNPAIASALEFLTTGVTLGTKIWVYWISPTFGMIAGLFLESYLVPSP